MPEVEVTNNESANRYEAHVDGELAGFAEYQLGDEIVVFPHTEVDSAYEGKGVGGALVRHALDEVRSHGECKVVPTCPFVKSWIDKHPEYQSLLYSATPGG